MCPETRDDYNLHHFVNSKAGHSFQIVIEKCKDLYNCDGDSNKIDNFVENVMVKTFIMSDQVQFDQRIAYPPVLPIWKYLSFKTLAKDKVYDKIIWLFLLILVCSMTKLYY